MNQVLNVKKLVKDYENALVLRDINLKVNKGQVISIIGPSGSGKTTLLRCVGMVENFESGEVVFDEKEIVKNNTEEKVREKVRNKIGLVFQDFHLWPHKTVLENVSYALINVKKDSKKEAIKKSKVMLKKVGLLDKSDDYPDSLSGGQKQRVAIARTLVMEPKIILFDEITSALDPELVGGILKIIKRLAKEGMTMIIVTHHMRFASEVSDSIIFLDKGRIIEQNTPQKLFSNPKEKRTKEFLSTIVDKKQEINVYEGYEDFQAYHIGLLKRVKSGCVGYVMGAVGDRWFECMGESYKEYEKLLKEKKIIWKWVSYKIEGFEKDVSKSLKDQLKVSLIPKKFATPSNFNIWEDTIILQTFGETPAIIEIRNKHLVQGYLNYFNLLWDFGNKINKNLY